MERHHATLVGVVVAMSILVLVFACGSDGPDIVTESARRVTIVASGGDEDHSVSRNVADRSAAGLGASLEGTRLTWAQSHEQDDGLAARLHESVLSEDTDATWSAEARREITSHATSVPYLSPQYSIVCGTIRCELAVRTQPHISDENRATVLKGLRVLAGENDRSIQVEGVFQGDKDANSATSVTVIYLRKAS